MKTHRTQHLSGFLPLNLSRKLELALAVTCTIFVASCQQGCEVATADERAERVLEILLNIDDQEQRQVASVYTLNTLCSFSRAASGTAEGRVEEALATYFEKKGPDVISELQKAGQTLDAIPATTRAELLGDFGEFDPGACTSEPDWAAIGRTVVFSHRLLPRLRADFCAGNLIYSDGTVADRAITVGSEIVAIGGIDPGDPNLLASAASPVILGVEGVSLGEDRESVTARHPALEASATSGDGMSPYGAETDIPCSAFDESGCDPDKGLVCGLKLGSGPRCVAFPVVQKDQTLILRGYNFWDIEEARLVFTPLLPGEGTESTTIVTTVDANEPTSGAEACPTPTPGNPTHNRAHFRVSANEGHFYKLTLYNHNDHFFTQQDALDHNDPRVIHTCYPSSEDTGGLPAGTIRDCTLPTETCAEDGATCSAAWDTPPRQLEECRHLPGEPVVCGETAEWFASAHLERRSDEFVSSQDPIVYVLAEEPTYEFTATLQVVECVEEHGVDWTGSDEPMLMLAGFPNGEIPAGSDADFLDKIDESLDAWKGGDYDSGERRSEVQLLSSLDGLAFDSEVAYLLLLGEDDGFLGGFLVGAVVIVGAAAIIYLSGGGALWTTALGTAGALAIWGAVMESVGVDDVLGRATFTAMPVNFDERIASTHAADFLTVSPPLFGALPTLEDGVSQREEPARVIHPFVDFSLSEEPLEAECNPGSCGVGQVCMVNRCVASDFDDPTVGVGFRERREFEGNCPGWGDCHYVIDLLWERRSQNP